MWARRQVLNIPTFCVGSVVAVTYADKWSEHGASKFVGVCVHINPYVNTKVNILKRTQVQNWSERGHLTFELKLHPDLSRSSREATTNYILLALGQYLLAPEQECVIGGCLPSLKTANKSLCISLFQRDLPNCTTVEVFEGDSIATSFLGDKFSDLCLNPA